MQTVNLKIVRLAYWLIRLRWYAIMGIVIAYITANQILHITIWTLPVYIIIISLIVLNLTWFSVLKYLQKARIKRSLKIVNRIINFQISTDLLLLTVLLHYSGGVENPFIIYYIFHMIIGSIILSTKESILQTSFALMLVGAMTFLEYYGITPHYSLTGFIITNMYSNSTYLICTGFVFITTSYFVVYITRTIVKESNKHELAYLQANIKLKQKDKIKDEYVMRISHDIKGHITAIQSCINVLNKKLSGPLNTQQEEFVNRASARIKILNKFILDLMSLTQMKLQHKPDKKYFNIANSLDNVLKTAENSAQEKNICLIKKVDPSLINIYGEQSSIEEVVLNLITNAIKYSPPDKDVSLTAEDKQDKVLIEVTDHGIGIPVDETDLVFNEFYRASNAKTLIKEGAGLGLSISKQIIENHGGKIWVNSKVDMGTTFSLLLKKEKY
jgi:signal transduction histidine kinase